MKSSRDESWSGPIPLGPQTANPDPPSFMSQLALTHPITSPLQWQFFHCSSPTQWPKVMVLSPVFFFAHFFVLFAIVTVLFLAQDTFPCDLPDSGMVVRSRPCRNTWPTWALPLNRAFQLLKRSQNVCVCVCVWKCFGGDKDTHTVAFGWRVEC